MKTLTLSSHVAQLLATVGIAGIALVGCTKPEQKTQTSAQAATASSSASTTVSASTPQSAATGIDPNKAEIVIGTTVGDFGDMVKNSVKPQLEQQGYQVKLVEFSDYIRPNKALADGDIDINVFQHKPYLDTFKKENNLDIVEAFQVPTAPLGLYAGKVADLKQVKDGATVAAPNDPSNFARALVMLNELGWVTLKANIDPLTASKNDIAQNPKNIKLVELEAAQLPRARSDGWRSPATLQTPARASGSTSRRARGRPCPPPASAMPTRSCWRATRRCASWRPPTTTARCRAA